MNKPPFDPSQSFQSSKPTFDASQPFESGKSLEGFAKNAVSDVGDIAGGLANQASTWAPVIGGDVSSVLPGLVKQGMSMMSHPKDTAEKLVAPIAHPVEYGYQHPVSQAMNALPLVGGIARGLGAASDVVSPNILGGLQETADSQLLKSIGTGGKEIRGLMGDKGLVEGPQAVADAANVARRAGLDDLLSTAGGRRKDLANYIDKQGGNIGSLRDEAGAATPGLLDTVAADVKPKYNALKPDAFSSESPDVSIAQNTIGNIAGDNPTNAGIAKGITGLNRYAAGNRVNLPKNALTDFAGKASAANDAEITQKLGSVKGEQYAGEQGALANESGAFSLEPAMKRGFIREQSARGSWNPLQKAADLGGNRLASAGLDYAHSAMTESATFPSTQAGVTSNIITRIQSSPESLGKYAAPLQQAMQTGGSQGVAAMHYVLSLSHPAYNAMMQDLGQ